MHPRKVGGSNPALTLSGQVSRVSLADLFATLESRGRSACVRFETASGEGNVWLKGGQLIDAEMGVLTGEAALYRILSLTQGSFEVSHEFVDRPQMIHDSVAALMAKRSKRAARWEDLVFGGPAIDAVPVRLASPPPTPESEDARRLLKLVDGRRSVLEILDESRLDPVQALELLNTLQQQGYFLVERGGSSHPPRPEPTHSREIRRRAGASGAEVALPRAATLVGLSPASSAPPPPEVRPPSAPGLERAHVDTLLGTVDPSWLEPRPGPAPESKHPDSGPAILVENVPDESGLTEAQLRFELAGERTLASFSDSGWPAIEVSSPQVSESIPPEQAPRPSVAPSFAPASTFSGSLAPGSLVGPYRVLFRLANSADGSVYLCREAEQGSVRNLFALKLYDQAIDADQTLHTFFAEAEIAGELSHPNALGLRGTGSFERRPLLVSDYVEGCSLAALLKRHPGERPARLIVAPLFDALRGLQAAHELPTPDGAGLIHGDLSPRDLLLGLDGTCRVSDLAASRAWRSVQPGIIPRDPLKLAYLSPERLLGDKIDARSDVFSLGVILYEALTGVELFAAPSAEEVRDRVLELPIEPPSRVGLRAAEAFDTVCLRALERDPQKRFATAREMLSALEEAALVQDTLASSSEVADWIASGFRRELELRRLSILDASRRSRAPSRGATSVPPPAVETALARTLDSIPPPPVTASVEARAPAVPSAAVPSTTLPSAVYPDAEMVQSRALALRPTARAIDVYDAEFDFSAPYSEQSPKPSRIGWVAGVGTVVAVAAVLGWLFLRSGGSMTGEPVAAPNAPTKSVEARATATPVAVPAPVPQVPKAELEPAAPAESDGDGSSTASAEVGQKAGAGRADSARREVPRRAPIVGRAARASNARPVPAPAAPPSEPASPPLGPLPPLSNIAPPLPPKAAEQPADAPPAAPPTTEAERPPPPAPNADSEYRYGI